MDIILGRWSPIFYTYNIREIISILGPTWHSQMYSPEGKRQFPNRGRRDGSPIIKIPSPCDIAEIFNFFSKHGTKMASEAWIPIYNSQTGTVNEKCESYTSPTNKTRIHSKLHFFRIFGDAVDIRLSRLRSNMIGKPYHWQVA